MNYEYKVVYMRYQGTNDFDSEIQQKMNSLIAEGWEYINNIPISGYSGTFYLVFRRVRR